MSQEGWLSQEQNAKEFSFLNEGGLSGEGKQFIHKEFESLYDLATRKGLGEIPEDRIKTIGYLLDSMGSESSVLEFFGSDNNRRGLGILIQNRLFKLDSEEKDNSEESRRLSLFLRCLHFEKVEVGAFSLAQAKGRLNGGLQRDGVVGGGYTIKMDSFSPGGVPQASVIPKTSETVGNGNSATQIPFSEDNALQGQEIASNAETAVISPEVSPKTVDLENFQSVASLVTQFLLEGCSFNFGDINALSQLLAKEDFAPIQRFCALDTNVQSRLRQVEEAARKVDDTKAEKIIALIKFLDTPVDLASSNISSEEQEKIFASIAKSAADSVSKDFPSFTGVTNPAVESVPRIAYSGTTEGKANEDKKTQGEISVESFRALNVITSDLDFSNKALEVIRGFDGSQIEDSVTRAAIEDEVAVVLVRTERIENKGLARTLTAYIESILKKKLGEEALARVLAIKIQKSRAEEEVKNVSSDVRVLSDDVERIPQEKAIEQFVNSFPDVVGDSFDAVDFVMSGKVPNIDAIAEIGDSANLLQILIDQYKKKYGGVFEMGMVLLTVRSGFKRAEEVFSDENYKDVNKGEYYKQAVAVKLLVEDCLEALEIPVPVDEAHNFSDTAPVTVTQPANLNDILNYSYEYFVDLAQKGGCPRTLIEKVGNIHDVSTRDAVLKVLTLFSDRGILERYLLAGEASLFEEGRLSLIVVQGSLPLLKEKDFITFVKSSKNIIATTLLDVEKRLGFNNVPEEVVARSQKLFNFIGKVPDLTAKSDFADSSTQTFMNEGGLVSDLDFSSESFDERLLSVEEVCQGVDKISERVRVADVFNVADLRRCSTDFADLLVRRITTQQDQRFISALMTLRNVIQDKIERIVSLRKNAILVGVEHADNERLFRYGEMQTFLVAFKDTIESYIPEEITREKKEKGGFFTKRVLRPATAFLGRVKGLLGDKEKKTDKEKKEVDVEVARMESGFSSEKSLAQDANMPQSETASSFGSKNTAVVPEVSSDVIAFARQGAEDRLVPAVDLSSVIASARASEAEAATTRSEEKVEEKKPSREETVKALMGKVITVAQKYNELPLSKKLLISAGLGGLLLSGSAPVITSVVAAQTVLRTMGSLATGEAVRKGVRNRLVNKENKKVEGELEDIDFLRDEKEGDAAKILFTHSKMLKKAERKALVYGAAASLTTFLVGVYAGDILKSGSEMVQQTVDKVSGFFGPSTPAGTVVNVPSSAPGMPASAADSAVSAPASAPAASVSSGVVSLDQAGSTVSTGGVEEIVTQQIMPGDTLTRVLLSEDVLRTIADSSFDSLSEQGKQNLVANIINLLSEQGNLASVGLIHATDVDHIFAGDSLNIEKLKDLIKENPLIVNAEGKPVGLLQRALGFSARLISR